MLHIYFNCDWTCVSSTNECLMLFAVSAMCCPAGSPGSGFCLPTSLLLLLLLLLLLVLLLLLLGDGAICTEGSHLPERHSLRTRLGEERRVECRAMGASWYSNRVCCRVRRGHNNSIALFTCEVLSHMEHRDVVRMGDAG